MDDSDRRVASHQPRLSTAAQSIAEQDFGPARTTPATKRVVFAWSLWDWGSAAFQAVVTTFVFSVYLTSGLFGPEAEVSVALGNAMLIAGVVIALLAPVLGRATDAAGKRKLWLGINTAVVVACIACMAFVAPAPKFLILGLVLLAVGNVAFEFGSVSYNAMIAQVSTKHNLGKVSGFGWGMGYLGGIVLLALVLLGFIQPDTGLFGATSDGSWDVRGAMLLCALWFAVFAVPVFFAVPEPQARGSSQRETILSAYTALFRSLRTLWRESRATVWFLITSAVFRDGLAGVFTFGAIIAATTFGFTQGIVIVFAIVANIVSGIATISVGALEDRVGARRIMVISLISMVVCGTAVFVFHPLGGSMFWVFGLLLCIFVGPVQSASRTYLARLIPAGKEGEIFGLYATTGRAVSFLAPAMWTLAIALGGSTIFGIFGIVTVLLAGLVLLLTTVRPETRSAPTAASPQTRR
jgi:UMF1 family MFS transporter